MNTIAIPEVGKTISLPSHWDECTKDQVYFIFQNALEVAAGKVDLNTFRVKVFCFLCDLEINALYYFDKRINQDRHLDVNATILNLSEQLCSWPFAETQDGYDLNFDTVVNYFYQIRVNGTNLLGPRDLLSDLTFAEFRIALREMDAYISDKSALQIDRFISILYRPEDPEIKSRFPFQADNPFQHIKLINSIPSWKKQAILLWFAHCVRYIQEGDIVIDGNTINLSPLFPKPSGGGASGGTKGVGWVGLLYDIAKEGLFGDVEKSDKTGLFDILTFLYKRHLDNKELEKKYNKRKK